MPTIKQNSEQQKAFIEVSDALEELAAINTITSEGWNGTISVVFNTDGKKGRSGTTKVSLGKPSGKEGAAIIKLMKSYATRAGKEALAKAQKYDILLEAKEKAILKGEPLAKDTHSEEPVEDAQDRVEGPQDSVEASHEPGNTPPTESLPDGFEAPHNSESVWEAGGEDGASSDADDTAFNDALRSFQNH